MLSLPPILLCSTFTTDAPLHPTSWSPSTEKPHGFTVVQLCFESFSRSRQAIAPSALDFPLWFFNSFSDESSFLYSVDEKNFFVWKFFMRNGRCFTPFRKLIMINIIITIVIARRSEVCVMHTCEYKIHNAGSSTSYTFRSYYYYYNFYNRSIFTKLFRRDNAES